MAGTRALNPVPASSTLTDPIRQARHLYEKFTGHQAKPVPCMVDVDGQEVYINIGRMDAVEYTTTRDGKSESYRHRFHPRSRPQLLASHDGKHARIVGGQFKFTERGFVDHDENDAPIE